MNQRRVRLVTRHLLDGRATTAAEAAGAVVALHATDPATVYLSVLARAHTLDLPTITQELYETRSLVRMMAMRRTLFVIPVEQSATFHHGVSGDVAATIRRRLVKELRVGPTDPPLPPDVEGWLRDVEHQVAGFVAEHGPVDGAAISRGVPAVRTALLPRTTKSYDVRRAVTSNVLTLMGTEGRLVRGRAAGSWTSRRHTWEPSSSWFPGGIPEHDVDQARASVLASYLRAFGPVTETDIAWWTGWPLGITRRTLAAIPTAELDDGLVLATDTDLVPEPAPTAALLPALDPTPMGWKQREWFLPEDASSLYDRYGNIGPTIWWGGEIIGLWAVHASGAGVVTQILDDRGRDAADAVQAEAERLTDLLGGTVVVPSFRTPGEKALATS